MTIVTTTDIKLTLVGYLITNKKNIDCKTDIISKQ